MPTSRKEQQLKAKSVVSCLPSTQQDVLAAGPSSSWMPRCGDGSPSPSLLSSLFPPSLEDLADSSQEESLPHDPHRGASALGKLWVPSMNYAVTRDSGKVK